MTTLIVSNTLDNGNGIKAKSGSLRAAIEAAKSGDVIKFDPSLANQTIRVERRYVITKDIVVDGLDVPGLTLSGGKKTGIATLVGNDRIFEIRNLTLADGSAHNGAALLAPDPGAKIVVRNSEFKDNVAGLGGAIWAKDRANVTILDSEFSGNLSTISDHTSGGAIAVLPNSKLTIKRSEFTKNTGISGGAVAAIFTETTVEDSFFKDNKATRWGGAIHVDGASVPASEGYYKGSLPRDTVGGNVVVRNSRFEENRSGGFGGAVSIWGYDQDFVTIEGNDFVKNQVTLNGSNAKGGALRVSGKQVTIKATNFVGNTSASEGGALWYQGASSTVIENATFSGNKAKQGGGLYASQWNGPGTKINNARFENNRADEGGAIYKYWPKALDVKNSTFVNNSSHFDGDSRKLSVDGVAATAKADGSFVLGGSSQGAITSQPPKNPVNNAISPLPKPVAKLSFDQLVANQAADSSTNGTDNVGWLYGSVTSTNGKAGKAVSFHGDSVVQLKNSKDINLGIHPERTISLWFQVDDAAADRKQVIYEEGGGARGLNIYLDDDLLYFGGWNSAESKWQGSWITTDKVTSGDWHHAALVLDGGQTLENGAFTAYVDGKEVGQMDGSQLWEHPDGIGIGNVYGGTKFHDGFSTHRGHGLAGAIDEFTIFNSALSGSQVQQLASSFV